MKTKPDLSFWKLWNLSFGFFGVQIAYALQSANVSRIFATLGADPHDLSYFWILPPLMGLVVQPIVGTASDRTWNRFGRRLPYLIFGALIAIIVMCLLPNAGSFGLAVSSAIIIGLIALMMLDTSINMAMQPFKMLVGDMVNEKQKGLAYSIQSFLCNAGSIVGYIFPIVLTWIGFRNTAAKGVIPETVVFSFYAGAAILLICVIYSLAKIKEWDPKTYAEYNGGAVQGEGKKEKTNLIKLLVKAPKTFWTVGLVQFFCWFAFLFMWTYTNGTIADKAFNTPETTTYNGINRNTGHDGKVDADPIAAKYILTEDSVPVISAGRLTVAGVEANGRFYPASNVVFNNASVDSVVIKGALNLVIPTRGMVVPQPMVQNGMIVSVNGVDSYKFNEPISIADGAVTVTDNNGRTEEIIAPRMILRDHLSQMRIDTRLITADIYTHDPNTGELFLDGVNTVTLPDPKVATYDTRVVLNTSSIEYNKAGNWVGVLFAIQAIGSVLWAVVLPQFRSRKFSYALSLILGAIGFVTAGLFTDPYLLFISFALIGCAWAAMLAWPFTILTNSLKGGNIGAYLGLFNCSICIPQIVAAIAGGWILRGLGSPDSLDPQWMMMILAGISLVVGALCVSFIKENEPSAAKA